MTAHPEFIQIGLPTTPANPTAINTIDDDDQNTEGKVPDELVMVQDSSSTEQRQ